MSDATAVSLTELSILVEAALLRGGMSQESVGPVAGTIVAAERDGTPSHGLLRLTGFIRSIEIGWADGAARPAIIEDAPGLLVADARNGFAQVALAFARERLAAKARTNGAALLLTRNAHHFAALWPDIEDFAAEGFVALTCVNSKRRMTVWGGGRPITGTNAMAFASPRANGPPVVWDQSSSVLSQGDVLLAAREGRNLPPGAGVDSQGRPTASPVAILEGGALLPFGGHKGASLAIMVEILAAALTGAPFGFEDRSPDATGSTSKGGQFLLLVDPSRATRDFAARVDALLLAVRDAGASRRPGDRRYRNRQKSIDEGVPIGSAAYAALLQLAGRT